MPTHSTQHVAYVDSAKMAISILKKDTSEISLFQDHLLTAKSAKPHIHFTNYDYFVAGVLFFSFVLYVWLYVSNRKRLTHVIKGFYITRYANQLAREEISLGNRVSVFLSILFVITITLFIGETIQYFGIVVSTNYIVLFLIIALCIIISYAVKLICIKLLGFIFQTTKPADDYIMTLFLFVNTLGLFMLPLVVCLLFVKQISPLVFIYSGLGVLLVFLCTRLFRGLVIGLNSRLSKFYLFLYLCTLEILPFAILVKLFVLKT